MEVPALTRSQAIKGLLEVKSAKTVAIVARIGVLLLLSQHIISDNIVSETIVEIDCRKCESRSKLVASVI